VIISPGGIDYMLKAMRKHSKYFLWLFVIVILSFVFWGVGTVDKGTPNILAEVGKYKITLDEYWRAYDNTSRFYREIYKENFNEEMQEKLKLKETVLDSLIINRVFLIAASDAGISVSDEELNDAITNDPAFMKDGVFDKEIYLNRLRLSRLNPELYESMKREELSIIKIRRLIQLSVHVPEPESDTTDISEDKQTELAIKKTTINARKEEAIKAFVGGVKNGLKIKVYEDLIL
jgi:peptidyl-prolyl cis-trans isomerase D